MPKSINRVIVYGIYPCGDRRMGNYASTKDGVRGLADYARKDGAVGLSLQGAGLSGECMFESINTALEHCDLP